MRTDAPRAALGALAVNHVGYSGPSWMRHLRVRPEAQTARKRGRPLKASADSGAAAAAGGAQQGRKRHHNGRLKRGGGGSWRSYLHTHLQGRFSAQQMQELRRTYLELSDEERAFHNSQGRMGTHGQRESAPKSL